MPVDAPDAMTLFRQRRDFGITAAMVTAIALAAGGAATAAISMAQTVNIAETLNKVAETAAAAMDGQAGVTAQLRGGLLIVNQRIDLVQEQVHILWQLAQLGCEVKMPGLCVMSIQYQNFTRAANLCGELSSYLLGNWMADFDAKMQELRMSIVTINSTRVDPALAKGLSGWLMDATDCLKEWAGMGAIGRILMLILGLEFWALCLFQASRRQERAVIRQALMAIETGHSFMIWLAALKEF